MLVVNCNLQRLDGPVRGNGKIIQELERSFRGADWEVIKVIWGSGWDGLLARDHDGVLRRRMDECLDGDYQRYSVSPGDVQREHWVEGNPELERMMSTLTDAEIQAIKRGGQDPKKVYAAFARARSMRGKPVVILVKTVKGDGLGAAQGKNTAHQVKNFSPEDRINLARAYDIPLADEHAASAEFYRPSDDSDLIQYLKERRRALGGYLPARRVQSRRLSTPPLERFASLVEPASQRAMSTTMAMVRMLSLLLRDDDIGRYVVPIVPDEARTFGMDGLFRVAGIYSPVGQQYTPVDAETLVPYRESKDGQILQEGICETGAMASFLSAGSAYAVFREPMIPFYIFYSMFGFQRVGDMIWSSADMRCRGFLLGGTAGRTTLNGEGIQHQDGHSHVLASTVPNLECYDPAFAFELAVIVRDGIRRMYELEEDCFYYITLYNQSYEMPPCPEGVEADAITSGVYRFSRGAGSGVPVHLLGSGAIMTEVLEAAERLTSEGYRVDVWSVTSYVALTREARQVEDHNRGNPDALASPFVARTFAQESGVFVAALDYQTSLPEAIARYLPGPFTALGTDGFGLSESRARLREHFEVSASHIVDAARGLLTRAGEPSESC